MHVHLVVEKQKQSARLQTLGRGIARFYRKTSRAPFCTAHKTLRRSASFELHLAEHDLPRFVIVRRALVPACQHLHAALYGGPRVDRIEPALDVAILRDVD